MKARSEQNIRSESVTPDNEQSIGGKVKETDPILGIIITIGRRILNLGLLV